MSMEKILKIFVFWKAKEIRYPVWEEVSFLLMIRGILFPILTKELMLRLNKPFFQNFWAIAILFREQTYKSGITTNFGKELYWLTI